MRERGFQLETLYYKADNGRAMAVYVLGDFVQTQKQTKSHGRMAINSKIKKELLKKHGNICSIWLEKIPAEELQVDHRIPFEIAGEVDEIGNYESYMLVSASENRQKSWTCEHCNNWQVKNKNTCKTCFWAYPENYTHVAGRSGIVLPIRLMDNSVVKKYEEEVKKHGAEETRHRIEYAVIKFLEEEET